MYESIFEMLSGGAEDDVPHIYRKRQGNLEYLIFKNCMGRCADLEKQVLLKTIYLGE